MGTAILTLNGDTSVTSGTLSATTGTVNYFGSGTQHVIATDYFLLAFANGSKILASSGTVGILDTFNPGGTSGHTIIGSTIDFNYREVLEGKNLKQNILLENGDIVMVR